MEYFNIRKFAMKYSEVNEDAEMLHEIREQYYFNRLLYKLLTRFKYDGLPETVRPEMLETQLLLNGTVGFAKGMKGFTTFVGNYSGTLDGYGIGENYVGANATDSFDGKIGESVVVGLNNIARLPETFFISRYAKMLGSTDESLYIQLLASRDTPVIEVEDDIEKRQYELAQKQREKGKPAVFVRPSRLTDIAGNRHPQGTNVLQPNNSGIIETLDNLNSLHDDLMKRFFLESGINISSKDKKAQLTVSEVDSYNDYSLINIEDNLRCREKMVEDINNVFRLNVSVELNEPYKTVEETYFSTDEITDDITDETTDEMNGGVDDEN